LSRKDRFMALQDKYINPFTDFIFKKLFGSEPNKDLLIDLVHVNLMELLENNICEGIAGKIN
jgi:hypothetical protein